MNYIRALQEMIKVSGETQSSIARKMGVCNPSYVHRALQPAVREHKGDEYAKRSPTMDVFVRIVKAANAKLILEWTDPRDCRKKKRWALDNSEYFGKMRDIKFDDEDEEV